MVAAQFTYSSMGAFGIVVQPTIGDPKVDWGFGCPMWRGQI